MDNSNGKLSFSASLDAKLENELDKIKKELNGIGDNAVKQGKRIDEAFSEAEESISKAFTKPIQTANKQITSVGDNAKENGGKIDKAFATAGATIAAAFTVDKIISFGKEVFSITAEFEKIRAVLSNTFGSEILADSAMSMISDFAAKTPFQVNELTAAFVKLANQGFVPTGKQMVALGDLASSTGKSFDQLAEAILDAQTGEFERLKEFGIKARDAGDQIKFSFKGVTTEVDKSSTAIRNYIIGLGDAQGVSGSMAKISETLSGQVSNLGDQWDQLLVTIGNGNKGVFVESISVLSKMLQLVSEYNEKMNMVSRYNLGENDNKGSAISFLLSASGAGVGMGALAKTATSSGQANSIITLRETLKKTNQETISGAKYVKDYMEAWNKLDKQRRFDVARQRDWNYAKAINEQYIKAQQELKANAEKLISDRNKAPDQGFGTSGKTDAEKQAERIAAAYKKLSDDLKLLKLDDTLSLREIDVSKIKSYEATIRDLISLGIGPADGRITDLKDKVRLLKSEILNLDSTTGATELFFKDLESKGKDAQKAFEDTKKAAEDFKKAVADMEATVDPKLLENVDPANAYNKQLEASEKKQEATKKKIMDVANAAGTVSSAIGVWAYELQGVNDELAYTLNQIAKIASDTATLAAGIATGDASSIAAGASGLLTFAFTANSKTKAMNAAARAEVQKYYDEAIKGEREYQSLLRQRELDDAKRGKNSYQAIIAQLDVLKKNAPALEAAYNKVFAALQGQEYVSGVGYKHGTWLRKAKTWDIMASLSGSDYDALEKLDFEKKLTGQTKADFDYLKSLREELKKAGVDVEDLQNQLKELLTGSSTSSLADGLTQLFKNGKLAAQDLGQSFEEIMKNAISNTFRYKYLEDQMQPFYEALAKMMEGNTPTKEQIDALQDMYEGIGGKAADYWKQLEQITGQDLSGKDSATSLTADTIRASLTEDTASKALGVWYGMWDMSKQQATFLEQINASDRAIEAHTIQSITLLTRIANSNESIDVKMDVQTNKLDAVVTRLDTIARNTNQNASSRDIGR